MRNFHRVWEKLRWNFPTSENWYPQQGVYKDFLEKVHSTILWIDHHSTHFPYQTICIHVAGNSIFHSQNRTYRQASMREIYFHIVLFTFDKFLDVRCGKLCVGILPLLLSLAIVGVLLLISCHGHTVSIFVVIVL